MHAASNLVRLGALLILPAALALLVLRPAGVDAGGGCHGLPAAEGDGTVVRMTNGCFTPTVLRVEPGTAVTFENDHATTHNVFGLQWGAAGIEPAFEFTQSFAAAGIYPYQCDIHPSMVGVVIVGDGGSPTNNDVTKFLASAANSAPAAAAAPATASAEGDGSSFPAWAAALAGLGGGVIATAAVATYRRRA